MASVSVWSDVEVGAIAPYFTNLDRPVFALVNLPETVKGALFARYSRSPKSLRRLFLDEFYTEVQAAPVGRGRRPRARGPAVPARLQRVRRRLGGAARRRAPGRRGRVEHPDEGARARPPDGVPRAVDALHSVHRAARRSRGGTSCPRSSTATRCAPQYVETLDAAFETYARWIDPMRAWFERALPEGRRRFGRRVPIGHSRQGARHAARPAAGGDPVERRHVRHGPVLRGAAAAHARASAGRGPRHGRRHARRAAPRDSGVSDPRRSARARRPLEPLSGGHARAHGRDRAADRREPARGGAGRRSDADRFRSRRRGQGRRRGALPRVVAARRRAAGPRQADDGRRARGRAARVRRRAIESPAQSGPRVRAHRVSVRRPHRLRRVPRPAAPPPADDRLAGADARTRLRAARGHRRGGRRSGVAWRHGPVGGALRRASRRRAWNTWRRTRCRWPIGCGS